MGSFVFVMSAPSIKRNHKEILNELKEIFKTLTDPTNLDDTTRNTIISKFHELLGGDLTHLQSKTNVELMSLYIETMTNYGLDWDENKRNTAIEKLVKLTKKNLSDLQSMNNKELSDLLTTKNPEVKIQAKVAIK